LIEIIFFYYDPNIKIIKKPKKGDVPRNWGIKSKKNLKNAPRKSVLRGPKNIIGQNTGPSPQNEIAGKDSPKNCFAGNKEKVKK
jgi:hypothetical protein